MFDHYFHVHLTYSDKCATQDGSETSLSPEFSENKRMALGGMIVADWCRASSRGCSMKAEVEF